MKSLVFACLLFVSSFVTAQKEYRIDRLLLVEIMSDDNQPIAGNDIKCIEGNLNNNWLLLKAAQINPIQIYNGFYDPTLTISRLKEKSSKSLSKVCFDCYEKEWQLQQNRMAAFLDSFEYRQNILAVSTADSIIMLANNMTSLAKRKFQYAGFTKYSIEQDWCKYYSIVYTEGETKTIAFQVDVRSIEVGGDRNLEISGTTYYMVSRMSGRYLDIFPIWQKYFEPNAEINEVLDHATNLEYRGLKFRDRVILANTQKLFYRLYYKDNIWTIELMR